MKGNNGDDQHFAPTGLDVNGKFLVAINIPSLTGLANNTSSQPQKRQPGE
jgi:hypothetical protein